MWGFQPHFRSGLRMATEHALESIGIHSESDIYLVGFLRGGDRHPICVEPESGPFSPAHFAGVSERAATLYEEDPERQIWHSDARLHRARQAGLRNMARARAVREVFEQARPEMAFHVGSSVLVEQHEVHPVIGLPLSIERNMPALTTRVRDRIHISVSLLEAVLDEILRLARLALYLPDPGSDLIDVLSADSSEIIRRGATRLAESTAVLAGELMSSGVFEKLNAISTLRYERREGIGRLLMIAPDNPALGPAVQFEPIQLSERRSVRKMLELSAGENLALLTDGRVIYGLGQLGPTYEPAQESAFFIEIVGEGTWQIAHVETALLRVEFGEPLLPRPRIEELKFRDIINRVFESVGGADIDLIWDLTLSAADAEHGTMLVISSSAQEEANRLGRQALRVMSTPLTRTLIAEFSKIDGAVLLAPDGTCHAIGVIVDGVAGDVGDRSRGARYNSAVRYLVSSRNVPTAIVLVSEDGMVEILPDLKPRIARATLTTLLNELSSTMLHEPPDFENFFRLFERLEGLEFYLSEEQCAQANQLREQMEERRWRQSQMRISHRALSANTQMNDSYFID